MTTYLEIRKHPRYKTRIDATVITPDATIPAIMTDISREGVNVHLEKPVSAGTRGDISLNLNEKIVLPGHVMWALKVETGINFQYMAGVKVQTPLYPERKGPGHLHKHEEFADVVCTILECGGMLHEKA